MHAYFSTINLAMKYFLLVFILHYAPVLTKIADFVEQSDYHSPNKRGFFEDSASIVNSFIKNSCTGPLEKDGKSPNGDSPTDSFETIVRNAGYNVTLYKAETLDGYINSLFRIYKGVSEPVKGSKGTPVLLMHGLMGSVKDWVLNDKEKVLPYRLVEDGRDVYVGANRGTPQSREHKTMNSEQHLAYWSFSYIEFAKYDDPAFADKMKEITGEEQLYYVGYDQGSKQFFAWMSLGPRNCSRIKAMFALAPVCFQYNTRSPILRTVSLGSIPAGTVIGAIGSKEFTSSEPFISSAKTAFCTSAGNCPICDNLMMALGGFNPLQANKAWQSMILSAVPAPTSTQNVVHSAQDIYSDRFGMFDYGPLTNTGKYGLVFMRTPPQLHVGLLPPTDVCAGKVNVFYSDNDWLSDTKDIMKLKAELGPVLKNLVKVEDPNWNHYDYLWGKDADKNVIDPLLKMMKVYD